MDTVNFSFIAAEQTVVQYDCLKPGKITTLADLRGLADSARGRGIPDARNWALLRVNHYDRLPTTLNARQILNDELVSVESDLVYAAQQALSLEEKAGSTTLEWTDAAIVTGITGLLTVLQCVWC